MTHDHAVDALARIVYGAVALTAAALHEATTGRELTFTQWRAILVAGETDEGYRITELAERLLGTPSSTGRLLRRLELRGLLSLEPDAHDRRVTRVRLTPAGAQLRAAVLAYRREQLARIVSEVDPTGSAEPILADLAERFEALGR